jgi:succinate-acetate transporter protein
MSHLEIHEIQTSQRAMNTEEMPITKIDEDVSMNLKLEKRITKTIITNVGKNIIQYKSIDHYGNTIPLGSSCIGFICITYGFGICNLYPINTLIFSQLFLQGLFGIVVPGILEYIKVRITIAIIYLITGFFFSIQYFILYYDPFNYVINYDNNCWVAYYAFWTLLFFVMTMSTFKSNLIITIISGLFVIFSFLNFIGFWTDSKKTIKVSGGFLITAGFLSLYLTSSQLLMGVYHKSYLPCFPYVKNNGIDFEES